MCGGENGVDHSLAELGAKERNRLWRRGGDDPRKAEELVGFMELEDPCVKEIAARAGRSAVLSITGERVPVDLRLGADLMREAGCDLEGRKRKAIAPKEGDGGRSRDRPVVALSGDCIVASSLERVYPLGAFQESPFEKSEVELADRSSLQQAREVLRTGKRFSKDQESRGVAVEAVKGTGEEGERYRKLGSEIGTDRDLDGAFAMDEKAAWLVKDEEMVVFEYNRGCKPVGRSRLRQWGGVRHACLRQVGPDSNHVAWAHAIGSGYGTSTDQNGACANGLEDAR